MQGCLFSTFKHHRKNIILPLFSIKMYFAHIFRRLVSMFLLTSNTSFDARLLLNSAPAARNQNQMCSENRVPVTYRCTSARACVRVCHVLGRSYVLLKRRAPAHRISHEYQCAGRNFTCTTASRPTDRPTTRQTEQRWTQRTRGLTGSIGPRRRRRIPAEG